MANYTVFTTYALVPTGNTAGYNQAIHCNYIKSVEIETDNLLIQEISLNFSSSDDFKFLSTDMSSGTGYTVHRIYMLIQTGVTVTGLKPNPSQWKIYDVTEQIVGYVSGQFLTPTQLASVVFKAPLNLYAGKPIYDLNYYLNYPSTSQISALAFGDETYFFGNVRTDIKADVYTTKIPINLSLNEFNSSDNLTWTGDKVYITEVGLYDSNKNLVGIGKLNNPVPKDSTISRTILFAIDF
jgi:hypothetical protein